MAAINARLSELQGDSKAMAIAAAGIEPRGRRKGRVAKAATARQGGRRPGVNRAAILKFLARKGRATIAEMQKAVAKAGGNPKYIQKAIQRMKAYGEIENVPNQRGVYQLKK
ncbi:MAG: hypothetical protein N3A66_10660 [Planctomycetota bacterium]|nr:hypothetical protein [Planctomycetota bacterium]